MTTTTTPDDDGPDFDPHQLNDVTDGEKDFQKELVDLYNSTTKERLPMLEKALKDHDKDKSILYSHDIKGASANIGALGVQRVSEKLEKLSRDLKYEEAEDLLPTLTEKLKEIEIILQEHLDK